VAGVVLALLGAAEGLHDRGLVRPGNAVLAAAVVTLRTLGQLGLVDPAVVNGLAAEIHQLRR
jgi:hypothetical protein